MRRREFIKTVGLGAGAWAVSGCMGAYALPGQSVSGKQILDEIDQRIEKYRKGDAVLRLIQPNGEPLGTGGTVRITQMNHKFLFGCNIFKLGRCRTPEENAAYEKHFAALLNFATLPFYWWNYERIRGKPDDARTEEIVRWCKAHNVTTKGHPLAWNWAEQPWLPDEPEAAMEAQFKRIERCVKRFAGDIDIWDVVNEATHYDREQLKQRAPKLTEAIRKMGVGAYVCGAFQTARKANSKATLIINDYRTDQACIDNVISKLVDENGRPLYDVIGIQSHMHGGYWGPRKTWEVCERFAKFGKPLHFTELTLVSGEQGWELRAKRRDPNFRWVSTPEGEKRQAEQVAEFYRILFSHPAVEAITWWDFTDQNAWQRAPAGLVRADMTPKPAYEQLQHLVKGQWWTEKDARIETGGKARFRGSFGQYKIATRSGDRRLTGTFRFDKPADKAIDVRLS